MGKYTTILFDLDGTVADTDELIVQTTFTMYDLYREGRRSPREVVVYFSGPPIRDSLAKEFPGQDLDFLCEEFRKISLENYPKYTTTYPGCIETLRKLKELGYKVGLVTNKIHSTTLYVMDLLKLTGIFETIVAADDVKNPKPNKEGMLKAMSDLGETDPSKVLYVGDNVSDLITSNNAGVDCALVTWGPRKLDPSLKCKYKVASYEELLEVIINE